MYFYMNEILNIPQIPQKMAILYFLVTNIILYFEQSIAQNAPKIL